MRWVRLIVCIGMLATPGPARAAFGTTGSTSADLEPLWILYRQRDFFALRDRLAGLSPEEKEPPETGFLRAAVEQAFNDPLASNLIVDRLLSTDGLEPELTLELLNLQLTNHLRLHQYAAALTAARKILSSSATDPDSRPISEARNKLPLLQALRDVPPQETEIRGPSRLALGQTRRVPLRIEGRKVNFALDTGANLSVIMRSEAQQLGLEIRPADIKISTATAKTVVGDVAVADSAEIGKIRYRNVVFLVLPDELLSFAGGSRVPGLVGFPLVEAMGEVRFRRDNVMEIPMSAPRRSARNLALNDLEPLVRVRYRKQDLLCRLDTGAGQTVFYEPFYRRFQKRIESYGHKVTSKAGGVGGFQEISAWRLPKVIFNLAAADVTLESIDVYSQSIRPPDENYLLCNVGLDVLTQFPAYVINFRDMSLILE